VRLGSNFHVIENKNKKFITLDSARRENLLLERNNVKINEKEDINTRNNEIIFKVREQKVCEVCK
jgi:hypothetical protein